MLLVRVAMALLAFSIVVPEVTLAQSGPAGKLTIVRGGAGVLKGDGSPISPAYNGLGIGAGDRVGTFSRSDARIDLADGSKIELGSDTTVIFHELSVSDGRAVVLVQPVVGIVRYRTSAVTGRAGTFRIQIDDTVAGGPRPDERFALASPGIGRLAGAESVALAPFVPRDPSGDARFIMPQINGDMITITTEDGDTIFLVVEGAAVFDDPSLFSMAGGSGLVGAGEIDPGFGAIILADGRVGQFEFNPRDNIFKVVADALEELKFLKGDFSEPDVKSVERHRRAGNDDDTSNDTGNSGNGSGDTGKNDSVGITSPPAQNGLPKVKMSTDFNRFKEPASGQQGELLFVVLDKPSTQTVSLKVTLNDGTATFNADYETTGLQKTFNITIPPGQTVASVPIKINQDSSAESVETFTATISDVVNATADTTDFGFEIED